MIKGKQCTVAWYVDDAKISHDDPEVVTMIINKLEEQFGKMTVTRGRKHIFSGHEHQVHRRGYRGNRGYEEILAGGDRRMRPRPTTPGKYTS